MSCEPIGLYGSRWRPAVRKSVVNPTPNGLLVSEGGFPRMFSGSSYQCDNDNFLCSEFTHRKVTQKAALIKRCPPLEVGNKHYKCNSRQDKLIYFVCAVWLEFCLNVDRD